MNSTDSPGTAALFARLFGLQFDRLLEPVSNRAPAGADLTDGGLYREIRFARSRDDPTLPAGVWKREMKQADWNTVIRLALEGLSVKSKDLQLAVWLLEAGIHIHGFPALAPCFLLIRKICETYWKEMYPIANDGDIDQRVNMFLWIDDKLSVALRLLPVTAENDSGAAFSQSDRDLARRYEAVKDVKNGKSGESSVSLQEIEAAMAATPDGFYESLLAAVRDASEELHALSGALDRLCGKEAPRFNAIDRFLDDIAAYARGELEKRGGCEAAEPEKNPAIAADGDWEKPQNGESDIAGRDHAYFLLSQAADYLIGADMHSPVPYLVKKAVEWGRMNAADLYRELFVKREGKIDIMELLGIDPKKN